MTVNPVHRRAWPFDLTDAELDVLDERRRQVDVEGWTQEHDDAHDKRELTLAAACYAAPEAINWRPLRAWQRIPQLRWPWDGQWWKPNNRRRNLIKAAALIIAEIERLDRSAP